jgi:hypothetical protein
LAVGAVGAVAAANGLPTPTAGAATAASFFAITPYRAFDSRSGAGAIRAGQQGDVDVWTDRNGTPMIPSTAQAVTYNLTVTNTAGGGYLSIYPAGTPFPGISSINWWAGGITIANAATVGLGSSPTAGPGSVTVLCGGGSTDLIIDVTGYYDVVAPAVVAAGAATPLGSGAKTATWATPH